MNYADIKPLDINNGDGLRVSLWVTGCPIKCVGCHNQSVWDSNNGVPYTYETEQYILNLMTYSKVDLGLSILGGEPLASYNYEEVLKLCKRVRKELPDRQISIWTGYTYEDLGDLEIFKYIDELIDGRYIQALKDNKTFWRGSTNQRKIKFKDGKILTILTE